MRNGSAHPTVTEKKKRRIRRIGPAKATGGPRKPTPQAFRAKAPRAQQVVVGGVTIRKRAGGGCGVDGWDEPRGGPVPTRTEAGRVPQSPGARTERNDVRMGVRCADCPTSERTATAAADGWSVRPVVVPLMLLSRAPTVLSLFALPPLAVP